MDAWLRANVCVCVGGGKKTTGGGAQTDGRTPGRVAGFLRGGVVSQRQQLLLRMAVPTSAKMFGVCGAHPRARVRARVCVARGAGSGWAVALRLQAGSGSRPDLGADYERLLLTVQALGAGDVLHVRVEPVLGAGAQRRWEVPQELLPRWGVG